MSDSEVVIVDAGIGNVRSVANMFRYLRIPAQICQDPEEVDQSGLRSMAVLPGVGSFDHGMVGLRSRGWDHWIRQAAGEGHLVLGLCLGMQVLCQGSDEGVESGLGLIPGRFRRMPTELADGGRQKVPHMGWNNVIFDRERAPWARDLPEPQRYYFVHSYRFDSMEDDAVVGWTDYGGPFASAIARDRVIGLQFHPEKSHRYGMDLLRSIWEWSRA